jgi:hypothetical protein
MPFTPPPQKPNFKFGVGRIATDRYDFEAHLEGTNPEGFDNFRHTADQLDMNPIITINGQMPDTVQAAIKQLSEATGTSFATTSIPGIVQLAGDITGTATNIIVDGLQGRPINTVAPTINQVLGWNGAAWTPQTVSGGGGGPSVAGTGIVHVTNSIFDTSAYLGTAGQYLLTNSSATDGYWTSLTGDVVSSTSTIGKITVVKLQGNPVSSTAPTINGQLLQWSGSIWGPTPSSPTPVTGNVLTWNGSNWAPAAAGGGGLSVSGSGFIHVTSHTIDGTASVGGAGQFALSNATGTDIVWSSLGGDVSNSMSTPGQLTITGIRGNNVPLPTGTGSQLTWNTAGSGTFSWIAAGGVGLGTPGQVLFTNTAGTTTEWDTLSGDISSAQGVTTVTGIRGFPVQANGSLTAGNGLYWNQSAFEYVSQPLNLSNSGGTYVNGVLSPSNGGTGLSSLGSSGTVLTSTGGSTTWGNPPGPQIYVNDGASVGAMNSLDFVAGSNVSLTYSTSGSPPNANFRMVINASGGGSFTAGGDLGGSNTNQTVNQITGTSNEVNILCEVMYFTHSAPYISSSAGTLGFLDNVTIGAISAGSGKLNVDLGGNGTLVSFIGSSACGSITCSGSTTSYLTSSDARLKENIINTTSGLSTLERLQVRDFNFIGETEKLQGFVAQELYQEYPQAVFVGGDNEVTHPWSVDYSKLTPLLIKSTQEISNKEKILSEKVELLSREVAELKLLLQNHK